MRHVDNKVIFTTKHKRIQRFSMVPRSSARLAVVALLACYCCCGARAFVVEPRYRASVPDFPNVDRQSLRQLAKRDLVVCQSNGINEGGSTDDNRISINEPTDDVLPKYNDGDSAVSVLSKRYFYQTKAFDNPYIQEERQPQLVEAFGDLTVGEVRQKCSKEELLKKAESVISMLPTRVFEFFAQGETLEDKLHNRIISFESGDEIKLIGERFTLLDSSAELLLNQTGRFFNKQKEIKPIPSRSDPAFFVLGPSGSGKSFFALKYVATFDIPKFEKQRNTTWYLKPAKLGFNATNLTARNLVDGIKERILEKLNRTEYEKLDMHVSIVIDEAGDSSLGGFFESKANIEDLLTLMKDLATSVRLVVSGTGLKTTNLDSDKDACKFRMQPWGTGDLDIILRDRFAFDEATRKNVIGAIMEQPTLNALSTNGRSAFYLLTAISSLRTVLSVLGSWRLLLASVVSDIVGAVVRQYIGENGLNDLSDRRRRRVAAWVLRAVRTARVEQKAKEPDFAGLTDKEKTVAMSLIALNVDFSDSGADFARDELRSAVLVTPAISLVLCLLLGLPATIFSTWRAQEQITGLYAFGAHAVNYLDQYRANRDVVKANWNEGEKEFSDAEKVLSAKLDEQLADLELLHVAIPVPSKKAQQRIRVPWLKDTDIWINGDKAKFADVIAPYILYQCKHCSTSDDLIAFDITKELRKCGLFKKSRGQKDNSGWIVLRWLVGVWSGTFKDDKKPVVKTTSAVAIRRPEERHLKSVAYPYNLLDTPTSVEEVSYRTITQDKTGAWTIDGRALPADPPANTRITFVFSTNAATIDLSGLTEMVQKKQADGTVIKKPEKVDFRLTADDLDEGRVKTERFNEQQKRVWSQLQAKFRCSVDLKFLLT
jgi:hypothetical protein